MQNEKPWTAFWKSPLLCVCYIPWGYKCLHRKQLLEKVTCLTRASHRISPCILNSPRFLLWKIILQPKEQSFWLEVLSYWYTSFLTGNKIQSHLRLCLNELRFHPDDLSSFSRRQHQSYQHTLGVESSIRTVCSWLSYWSQGTWGQHWLYILLMWIFPWQLFRETQKYNTALRITLESAAKWTITYHTSSPLRMLLGLGVSPTNRVWWSNSTFMPAKV